jgi:hypothetical protein
VKVIYFYLVASHNIENSVHFVDAKKRYQGFDGSPVSHGANWLSE